MPGPGVTRRRDYGWRARPPPRPLGSGFCPGAAGQTRMRADLTPDSTHRACSERPPRNACLPDTIRTRTHPGVKHVSLLRRVLLDRPPLRVDLVRPQALNPRDDVDDLFIGEPALKGRHLAGAPGRSELDLPRKHLERVMPRVGGAVQRRGRKRAVGLAPPPVGGRLAPCTMALGTVQSVDLLPRFDAGWLIPAAGCLGAGRVQGPWRRRARRRR